MSGDQKADIERVASKLPPNEDTKRRMDEVREEMSSGRIGGVVLAGILFVWFLSNFA